MPQAIENKDNIRTKLIFSAMQLYAEKGLDAVSLRQIGAAAGAKNTGVIQYHFGDKFGVLDAINELIYQQLQLLWSQQSMQTITTVNELVNREVQDWATVAATPIWGEHAIILMSRLLLETDPRIRAIINRYYTPHTESVSQTLSQIYPDVPPLAIKMRTLLAISSIVHGTAEWPTVVHSPLGDLSIHEKKVFQDNLRGYVESGLKFELQP